MRVLQGGPAYKKAAVQTVPRLRLPAIAALGASAAPSASCTVTAAPRTPAQTPSQKAIKQPARPASAAAKAGPPPPVAVPELAVPEAGGRAAETPGSTTTAATGDSPFGVMQAEGKLTPQRLAALAAASEQVGLTARGGRRQQSHAGLWAVTLNPSWLSIAEQHQVQVAHKAACCMESSALRVLFIFIKDEGFNFSGTETDGIRGHQFC